MKRRDWIKALSLTPNLVAADAHGRITQDFNFPMGDWKPSMWGNNVSVAVNPTKTTHLN